MNLRRPSTANLSMRRRTGTMPPAQVIVTPSQDGITLDVPAAQTLVLQTLVQTGMGDVRPLPDALPLPTKTMPARLREESLGRIDTVLSTFTTAYATSTANRARNVETAAAAINGAILAPGEVFSFNKNRRTAQLG